MGHSKKYLLILFLSWGVFFIALFSRMMTWNEQGIFFGHENLWSDWALHLSLVTIFAEKNPAHWFAYHPVFADGKLTYAFLTNLVSGLLVRAGLSYTLSFILPSIVFALLLILAMFLLLELLLESAVQSLLAISLFFLSSGLGFLKYFTGNSWLPSRQYSPMEGYGWGTSNFIVGQLLPQRAFLMGMMLAVWGLYGLFRELLEGSDRCRDRRGKTVLAASGVAVGLLPIAHMHSLIALLMLLLPVFVVSLRKWRIWLWFGIPAGLLSTVLFFVFIFGGIQVPHFMSWSPGYTSHGLGDWLNFWFSAWGLMIPAACAGFWAMSTSAKRAKREVRVFLASSFGIFAIANLVLFQPIAWDNTKLFLWCYFGFSALAARALAWLWVRGAAARSAAVLIALALTLTGALELIYLQRVSAHTFQLLSSEELDLADEVRQRTGPLDRFLTAKDHRHPITVRGGRPVLLGYTGWALNFGFDYAQTESDVDQIYRGGEEARTLLARHRISYVVIGPPERGTLHPNEEYFQKSFPVAFQTAQYRVYDVRSLLK